ncbi:aspartic proteinase CDR1-like [Rhodamnia argentea]|uniref:Aspartic proteinase CDR1-like n=1 Tax=Rhodamnia argentea TaxID=178133 RepID=A0A8B8PL90_9MYRT|nr:aspartic proteinase CDR1-like [Rhodamnia argentea]
MPPAPQLVEIDTASDLLWFQCLPCTTCFKQSPPLFDPAKSSTYSNIPCGSEDCRISRGKCDAYNKYCLYQRSYLDGTSTAGNLASEQATFETSDEGTIRVPIKVFGCGHVNKDTVDAQESEILGLSEGYASLTHGASKTKPMKPPRLAMTLVHPDSIHSPYYNPNATAYDLVERAINGSIARILSLSKRVAGPNDYAFRAGLIADNRGIAFIMKIPVGTPPAPQLLLIDTGSDLFWFQCKHCISCFKQSAPLFDPAKSSSYSNIRCNSAACAHSTGECDRDKACCTYLFSYVDGAGTRGNFASENVTFETSDEGTMVIPIRVVRCGHENKGSVDGQVTGTLGLSYHYYASLVQQVGSKFSIRIGDIHDPHYQYNQLVLGDDSVLEGHSTTLDMYGVHHYVNLQGISVGETRLKIDPGAFKRAPSGHGGVALDLGSVLTWLKGDGYVPLHDEVRRLLDPRLRRVEYGHNPEFLCYVGTMQKDLQQFPVVTFRFEDVAELVLDIDNMFFQVKPNMFCMTVVQSDVKLQVLTLIGVFAQQFHNIGYDILARKLFIQRIDCGLLDRAFP